MLEGQNFSGCKMLPCLVVALCFVISTGPAFGNDYSENKQEAPSSMGNSAGLTEANSEKQIEIGMRQEGDSARGLSVDEVFSEELLLRPLPDGKVLAHFQFTSELGEKNNVHHKMFPKAIDHLVRKFSIREMELSFTQGRWDYAKWGLSDSISRVAAKPAGVELWVWFDLPDDQVDATWRNLTHAISGLFCASVNYLEGSASVAQPAFLLCPDSKSKLCPRQNRDRALGPVRYGALPREAVCTENLTPWLKLLPCRDQAGLTTLLHRPTVYGGHYHALRVHVIAESALTGHADSRRQLEDSVSHPRAMKLTQTLTTVHRPVPSNNDVKNTKGKPNWSIKSLFKQHLAGSCPVASSSNVYLEIERSLLDSLDLPEHRKGTAAVRDLEGVFQVRPEPDQELLHPKSAMLLRYDVARRGSSSPLNVGWSWRGKSARWRSRGAPFRASWTVTGHGNERGGLAMILKRDDQWGGDELIQSSGNVEVVVFQMIPWWIRLYMHTLRVAIDEDRQVPLLDFATRARLTPAEDRKQPAVLELILSLPLNASTIMLLADFDKGYLRVDEHPPDSSRGLDIPSALLLFPTLQDPPLHSIPEGAGPLLLQMTERVPVRMYTESLLVRLPIPDFSMPYNVVTLTCTALAMFVGSLFNALRRRFCEEDAESAKTEKGMSKLKAIAERLMVALKESKLARLLLVLMVAGIIIAFFLLDEKGFFRK